MRFKWLATYGLVVFAAIGGVSSPAAAQATGSLEFEAMVNPSGGGQPEPVRQLTFYLLRKDFTDIRKEADQSEPAPDLAKFIDGLEVSVQLKTWMKKNRTAEFTGNAFTKSLTADDIMNIPEFLEAYKNLNGAILNATIPPPQLKESDRVKNPEKYQKAKEKYEHALHQYIANNPQSTDGLDAELTDKNLDRRWAQKQADQKQHVEERALILAQTQYLAAKSNSDLNGRGVFSGMAPGTYWITTLGIPALGGDVRLQWDVPVTIQAGQTARLTLSNFNALPRQDRTAH